MQLKGIMTQGTPLILGIADKSTNHRNKADRNAVHVRHPVAASADLLVGNAQVRPQEMTERERSMAFMEGFSSEKLVVLEHMRGHIPFHPRHLVDHQTLLSIPKETFVKRVTRTSTG